MARPLILLMALACLSGWLTRHAWLTNPTAFTISQQVAEALGLDAPTAQRPELLSIASHAKLQTSPAQQYQIHGQIYNGSKTPLAAPRIVFIQRDRDNQVLQTIHFNANDWQGHQQPVAANGFANFVLHVPTWPSSSWGYQIQLSD